MIVEQRVRKWDTDGGIDVHGGTPSPTSGIFDVGRYVETRSTDLLRAGYMAIDLEPA